MSLWTQCSHTAGLILLGGKSWFCSWQQKSEWTGLIYGIHFCLRLIATGPHTQEGLQHRSSGAVQCLPLERAEAAAEEFGVCPVFLLRLLTETAMLLWLQWLISQHVPTGDKELPKTIYFRIAPLYHGVVSCVYIHFVCFWRLYACNLISEKLHWHKAGASPGWTGTLTVFL